MAKFPTMEEFAKGAAEKVLDDYEFNGKTIREWAELVLNGKFVEVVRCKDCKGCTNTKEPNVVYCKTLNRFRRAFDFCSYGERREGE